MARGTPLQYVTGGAVAVGALAVFANLARRPESQIFGRTLVAGDDPNEIALTYDDGPNLRSTPELLEVLARHDVRATFFMIGKFVRQRRAIVRAVQAAGHLIGNHTQTHPFLANKSANRVREELRGCNEVLEDALGERVRYFRAPYGARRPAVLRIARELGLTPVQWNTQGNDWEPIGAAGILRNVEAGLRRVRGRHRGANILLHDGFEEYPDYDRGDTVRATDLLLERMRSQGRRLVRVDAWS